MSARNARAHGDSTPETFRMVLCPNCGCDGAESKSNHIDVRPFRVAARGAKMLRALGHNAAAADVLTRLASVRIINFIRPARECLNCGACYDQ